jgi:hypothetical protein
MLDRVRESCARVAARSRFVRVRGNVSDYALGFDLAAVRAPAYDREHHYVGEDEAVVAYVLVLDAVNFGSGFFPALRKRPGCSGYTTVATALTEWFRAAGPPPPEVLRAMDAGAVARVLGQDLADPLRARLMELYAEALNELGSFVVERFGGHYDAVVRGAGRSAERLAAILAEMPMFRDVWPYDGFEVPLYKRAQIAASDLGLAFAGEGYGAFHDLASLTMFADNLVPHVLHVDGVLEYAPALAHRIQLGERIAAGSPEEVEIRAVALHAVERMVTALRAEGAVVTARELDIALWNRGQSENYRRSARHRTLTTAY